ISFTDSRIPPVSIRFDSIRCLCPPPRERLAGIRLLLAGRGSHGRAGFLAAARGGAARRLRRRRPDRRPRHRHRPALPRRPQAAGRRRRQGGARAAADPGRARCADAGEDYPQAPPRDGSGLPGLDPLAGGGGHVRRLGLRGAAPGAAAAARVVPHAHGGGGSVLPAGAGARGPALLVSAAAAAAGDALVVPRVRGGGGDDAGAGVPLVRARRGHRRIPLTGGANRAPGEEIPLAVALAASPAADPRPTPAVVRRDDARLLAVDSIRRKKKCKKKRGEKTGIGEACVWNWCTSAEEEFFFFFFLLWRRKRPSANESRGAGHVGACN
ncbi:Os04g0685700, partial [Oryza sativa Japonica Group]